MSEETIDVNERLTLAALTEDVDEIHRLVREEEADVNHFFAGQPLLHIVLNHRLLKAFGALLSLGASHHLSAEFGSQVKITIYPPEEHLEMGA